MLILFILQIIIFIPISANETISKSINLNIEIKYIYQKLSRLFIFSPKGLDISNILLSSQCNLNKIQSTIRQNE